MNSKERVLTALRHDGPDRIPLDFGSSSVTGMHVSCVAALRDYYGLEKRPTKVHEPCQMLGLLEADLLDAMGADVVGVIPRKTKFGYANDRWKEWNFRGLDVLVGAEFNTSEDPDGSILIYPEGDLTAPPSGRMPTGSAFFDAIIRQSPLDDEHLDPRDNLEEFGLISDGDLDYLERSVQQAALTGRAVFGGFGGTSFGDIALVPAPALKHPKGIRDVTEWYISTRSRRGYIHQVFEAQCELALRNLAAIHDRIGNFVEVMYVCGTDFGTQTSAFCSVPAFRELWLPYYKRVNDWVHANTKWKTFKHSCGSVARFYESFIEAGFDVVNPVQCSAAGMDPVQLKREYGSRLVFWGGGVDTQRTLPFGRPQEVREEVLRRCEIFAPGGGFVFNAIHNLQAGTPVDNIVAMIEAVHEFNGLKRG